MWFEVGLRYTLVLRDLYFAINMEWNGMEYNGREFQRPEECLVDWVKTWGKL